MSRQLKVGEMKVDAKALKALSNSIKFMPEKVASRRLMVGMKRAMKPTLNAAKLASPMRSGALRKSYHVVNGRRAVDGSPYVVMRINPKASSGFTNEQGASLTAKPKSYFHIIADGMGPKSQKTNGKGFTFFAYDEDYRPLKVRKRKHPGIDGEDYIGDAWQRTQTNVKNTMLGTIQKSVDQYKQKHGLA